MTETHQHAEEQILETQFGQRLLRILRRHGKTIAVVGGIVVVAILLTALWFYHRREMIQAGFSALEAAAGQPEQYAAVAREYAGTPAAAYARFQEANALLDADRYDDALQRLEAFERDHPDHPLLPQVEFLKGVALEGKGDLAAAAAVYGEIAAQEGHPRAAEALAARARCLRLSGDIAGARQALEDLLARYPRSPWSYAAREDLDRIRRQQATADEGGATGETLSGEVVGDDSPAETAPEEPPATESGP